MMSHFGENIPITPFLHSDRAQEKVDRGDLKEAESLLEQALAVNPRFVPALQGMGYVKLRRGDTGAAQKYFSSALYYNRDLHMVNYYLGGIAESRGKKSSAKSFYRKVLENNPACKDAQERLAVLEAE